MPHDHYIARVHAVMNHVRANLDCDLSLNELARVAHFSPYHFHRIFKSVAGETVAEFARRARLERAAYLMKASPQRQLSSIALDVGFPSQSEFSRAFSRQYGMAPSAWDRRSRLDGATSVGPATTLAARDEALGTPAPFDIRVVEYPACRLAYLRMRTWFKPEVVQDGYARLTSWLESRDVDWKRSPLITMAWDNYETTPLDQVRCDLGFVVPNHFEAEGEFGTYDFPAVRCVNAHCEGELQRVADAWDYLYDVWLPASDFEPDDMPALKRFRTLPHELDWKRWDVDCSIVLRPRRP